MKASEIFEDKKVAQLPKGSEATMLPSMIVPDLDGYYELYRMLITLAGLPDKDTPLSSVVRDVPYISPYSQYEHDAVVKILKKMGKKPTYLSKMSSQEPKETQKISPVRAFKDYE